VFFFFTFWGWHRLGRLSFGLFVGIVVILVGLKLVFDFVLGSREKA